MRGWREAPWFITTVIVLLTALAVFAALSVLHSLGVTFR